MSKINTSPNKPVHKITLGGQALIEGIMMRGAKHAALVVRQKDGGFYTEKWEIKHGKWYQKIPFVRGCFNFFLQMADGMKYINISAEKSGMYDEIKEPPPDNIADSPTDKSTDKSADKSDGVDNVTDTAENAENTDTDAEKDDEKYTVSDTFIAVFSVIGMLIGVAVAIGLFFFAPTLGFTGIKRLVNYLGGDGSTLVPFRSAFEGIIKMVLFVAYMAATGLLKEIRRTYEYHGAEHKTIAAMEALGDPKILTPEIVRPYCRFHPRCGTSFIFLSLIISILFYSIVPLNSETLMATFGWAQGLADIVRTVARIILMPVIVGLSYEVIRIAGKHTDKLIMRIISAPGLALQRLTTREPDDGMLEVAIRSVQIVLDDDEPLTVYPPKTKKAA
ncbi:MAG: DUF1385 domain-containing protein [Oscillospiraceae bacterium]|jgi:uncharacterized protein YqhQ|nr:DUF1385 domain-containing protein [Oscillospiraceae bacterium]